MSSTTPTIGYYVHHVGSGHLHRATTLAEHLGREGVRVTGLSSLPRPHHWTGDWVQLPRDDDAATRSETAHGRLHWAPLQHDGQRGRSAAISAWLDSARPDLVVVDVSVEVALLVRLHGTPVVGVVLPGRRDDAPHLLGLGVAEALVGFWPGSVAGMAPGLPAELGERLMPVGALSRHRVRDPRPVRPASGERQVVLMLGSGGHDIGADDVADARRATPGWRWRVLGADRAGWVDDPSSLLAAADVVVTHAGQNAVAETAAARRPAVVLPQPRPHREQATTADVLEQGWPAVVCRSWPAAEAWPGLLDRAAALDPARWSGWCDGLAAERFAEVVLRTHARTSGGTTTTTTAAPTTTTTGRLAG